MVTLCATALREWLLERDALPEDPLVAMIPVSVRTEEERGAFGNRVSTMIVPLPDRRAGSARAADARARLAARGQGDPQRAAGRRC